MIRYRLWTREAELSSKGIVSVVFVGDIMLSRNVAKKISLYGPEFPFFHIKPILSSADIVFGNLEGPISSRGQPTTFAQSHFRANPCAIKGLENSGFDIIALANNHIYDYGDEAIEETLSIFERSSIKTLGVGKSFEEARRPVIFEIFGIKIGFLAYTSAYNAIDPSHKYVAAPLRLDMVIEDIKKIRNDTNVLVISIHGGYEGVKFVMPDFRKKIHKIATFRPDLIICHHPHVIQGIEKVGNTIIAYSLGDLVFDNFDLYPTRRESIILEAILDKKGVSTINIIPIWINDDFQPELDNNRADRIIDRIRFLSYCLENGDNDKLFWKEASRTYLRLQKESLWKQIKQHGIISFLLRFKYFRVVHLKLLIKSLIEGIFSLK